MDNREYFAALEFGHLRNVSYKIPTADDDWFYVLVIGDGKFRAYDTIEELIGIKVLRNMGNVHGPHSAISIYNPKEDYAKLTQKEYHAIRRSYDYNS